MIHHFYFSVHRKSDLDAVSCDIYNVDEIQSQSVHGLKFIAVIGIVSLKEKQNLFLKR
jgi:hypothetical protein